MRDVTDGMALVRDVASRWPSPAHMLGRLREVPGAQPLEVSGSWPILQAYNMDGGEIVGTGPVSSHSFPAEAPEVLQEFLRVFSAFDTPSETGAILSFC